MEFRRPTSDEIRVLCELATLANIERPEAWTESLSVREMDDGGMGSLEFDVPPPHPALHRGAICRAAVQFVDADGVPVVASIYAREDGLLYELDMWKANSSKLIRIPYEFQRFE